MMKGKDQLDVCSGRISALIGSIIAGILTFAGGFANEETKKIDRGSQLVTVGAAVGGGCRHICVRHIVVHGNTGNVELFTWITSGTLEFSWAPVACLPLLCF